MGERLGAFVAISSLLIVVPGPDMALVTRNALLGGRRSGISTGLGAVLGLLVWTLAASLGVAALLRASEPAFVALKLAGGAYLVYLGVRSLAAALRRRSDPPDLAGMRSESRLPPFVALRQGLLSNLGNPKIAVFFTSFLPQFVPTHHATFASFLLLGLLFSLLGLVWLTLFSIVVARVGDLLRRPRVRRMLDAVTGTVLVAFGIKLATERG